MSSARESELLAHRPIGGGEAIVFQYHINTLVTFDISTLGAIDCLRRRAALLAVVRLSYSNGFRWSSHAISYIVHRRPYTRYSTQDLVEAETILTTQLSEAPIFTTSSTSQPSLASRNLALASHHVKTKGTNAVGARS